MLRWLQRLGGILLACIALAGCSAVLEKVRWSQEASSAMQRGHDYKVLAVVAGSMEPYVRAGGAVLIDLSSYRTAKPQRNEVIAFSPPVDSSREFLKRIIAVPGDTLEFRHGKIIVNGKQTKNYSNEKPGYDFVVRGHRFFVGGMPLSASDANIPAPDAWTAPNKIPPGCYLAFGDKINDSEDSHIFGCVQLNGAFFSGPLKGKPAHISGKVVKVL
ncbi:MAG: signal peptidase I [Candidatus Eremiobacteraeota bacterium]|nr:signal peptidase I [Candidatus Eremiobacteraeota bacterium]